MWFQNRRARSIKRGKLIRPIKKTPATSSYTPAITFPHPNLTLPSSAATDQRNTQRANRNNQQAIDWVRQALGHWPQNLPHSSPSVPTISPDIPEALTWRNGPSGSFESTSVFTEQTTKPIPSSSQHQCRGIRDTCTNTTSPGGVSGYLGKAQCNINLNRYQNVSVDQVVPSQFSLGCWEGALHRQGHRSMHYPQTSLGDISDLIYNAAVVTNLENI